MWVRSAYGGWCPDSSGRGHRCFEICWHGETEHTGDNSKAKSRFSSANDSLKNIKIQIKCGVTKVKPNLTVVYNHLPVKAVYTIPLMTWF